MDREEPPLKVVEFNGIFLPYIDPATVPETTRNIQQDSYKNVMDAVRQNGSAFTLLEKMALQGVEKNMAFGYSVPSSVQHSSKFQIELDDAIIKMPLGKRNFTFNALPKELEKAGTKEYGFIAAHEFKHATLAHNASMGVPNIRSLQSIATRIAKPFETIAGFLDEGADALKDLDAVNDSKFLKESIDAVRFITAAPFRVMTYACIGIQRALSRKEEKMADLFALRAFPDKDPAQFINELGISTQAAQKQINKLSRTPEQLDTAMWNLRIKERKKTHVSAIADTLSISKFFTEMKFDFFATHPSDEQRVTYLQQAQATMQKKKDFTL